MKAVEVADMLAAKDVARGGIGVVAPEVDQLLQVTSTPAGISGKSGAFHVMRGSISDVQCM